MIAPVFTRLAVGDAATAPGRGPARKIPVTDTPPSATPLLAAEPPPNIESDLRQQLLLTKVDSVLTWARRSSLWPAMFGLACCAIEMIATANARYDIARFGAGPVEDGVDMGDRLFGLALEVVGVEHAARIVEVPLGVQHHHVARMDGGRPGYVNLQVPELVERDVPAWHDGILRYGGLGRRRDINHFQAA